MKIGERLKELRITNGYTQKEIAEELGLEFAAISKYENNLREPNMNSLIQLSKIFNVSADHIYI